MPEARYVKAQDEVLGERTNTIRVPEGRHLGGLVLLQLCGATVIVRNRLGQNFACNECRPSGTQIQNQLTQDFVLGFQMSCRRH